MFGSLFTGFGFWDFGSWLLFFVIAGAMTSWLRAQGRNDCKKGTERDGACLSDSHLPDAADVTVPASSSCLEFKEALEPCCRSLLDFHSGDITAYVGWFVVATAVVLVLIVL